MNLSPALRISIGLVSLTVVLLLVADLIGLSPTNSDDILANRQRASETLAVQLSTASGYDDAGLLRNMLWAAVRRNESIRSASIRRSDGVTLAEVGEPERNWRGTITEAGSLNQTLTPLYRGGQPFGELILRFTPLPVAETLGVFSGISLAWVGFIGLVGFLGYWLIIRRCFRFLDPAAVVPSHVRNALDTLVEGVLILDRNERIVLANAAFERKVNLPSSELIGRRASELNWTIPHSGLSASDLPWKDALRKGQAKEGAALGIRVDDSEERIFVVNGSPILDGAGKGQGVLASFEDITELEARNEELHNILEELQRSRHRLLKQNEQLHTLATRDPLTGALNRRSFFECLEAEFADAQGSVRPLACIMADIDHFKQVNDTHGHSVGDSVIKQVAEILRQTVRDDDRVGRYGGEEFCVLLPGMDLAGARMVAERCRHQIAANAGLGFSVSASFGVADISEQPGSPEEMMEWADKALYISKESGRNRVTCWDTHTVQRIMPLQAAETERLRVERDLDKALENNEFELFYQPQVNRLGQVVGAEALLRWNKPGEGFISPARFISIAEESGQILAIGEWVLQEACRQLSHWKALGINPYFRRLAVNVSPLQFQHHQFVDNLHGILAQTGTNPAHLELELTENMLISDVKGAVDKMKSLKEMEISFSIDDFGTGYSSLLYLRHLPLDQLKIDQSFVRDLLTDANDAAIVNTIIAMASSLELQTIAEGVETQAEMEKLREMGCQTFQGYYLSRPVPQAEFENLLRHGILLR